MKVVYIAGPYRGTPDEITENIYRARTEAKRWWAKGCAVICPHMNSAYMDGAASQETFLDGAIEIMKRCDLVVVLPGWNKSSGTKDEIIVAECSKISVIFVDENGDVLNKPYRRELYREIWEQ